MTNTTHPQIIRISFCGEEVADYCERCTTQLDPHHDDERLCSACIQIELEEDDWADTREDHIDSWRGVWS